MRFGLPWLLFLPSIQAHTHARTHARTHSCTAGLWIRALMVWKTARFMLCEDDELEGTTSQTDDDVDDDVDNDDDDGDDDGDHGVDLRACLSNNGTAVSSLTT